MFEMTAIGQPGMGKHSEGIADLVGRPGVSRLDVAVAYATTTGVFELLRAIGGNSDASAAWNGITKRWLVGIDWMRTDPAALALLDGLPKSTVRIHDGANVIGREACWPQISWHPKHFAVSGPGLRGALHGSANLSRNGLTTGHEFGSLVVVKDPTSAAERKVDKALEDATKWFRSVWGGATDLVTIQATYAGLSRPTSTRRYAVTEDDASPSTSIARSRQPTLPSEMLNAMRTAEVLWIQADKHITQNLGKGNPGNQPMASLFTRVFFGFPATDIGKNTTLGDVMMTSPGGGNRISRPIRVGNNGMEIITLQDEVGTFHSHQCIQGNHVRIKIRRRHIVTILR